MADAPVQQSEIAQAVEAAARQRELDAAWKAHEADHDSHDKLAEERWGSHRREHETMEESLEKAHNAATAALKAALADHHREHEVHAAAHEREHVGHTREHHLNEQAVAAAAKSVDDRLAGMNEFRDQLRDQARTFASSERLDAIEKANAQRLTDFQKTQDDKLEVLRLRIENIEKGDVKQEGKSLGQGAVIAIIVGAIGLVGTILGIVVVLSNFATGA